MLRSSGMRERHPCRHALAVLLSQNLPGTLRIPTNEFTTKELDAERLSATGKIGEEACVATVDRLGRAAAQGAAGLGLC
jgi:hypothetical protein